MFRLKGRAAAVSRGLAAITARARCSARAGSARVAVVSRAGRRAGALAHRVRYLPMGCMLLGALLLLLAPPRPGVGGDQLGAGSIAPAMAPDGQGAMLAGPLIRIGRPISEPFDHRRCANHPVCELPRPVLGPPGTLWLLADRGNAPDHRRRHGPIPAAWISGLIRALRRSDSSGARAVEHDPARRAGW